MIFGFLLFTSCPKPTWSESSVQTPPQTLWAPLFSSDTTIHSDTQSQIKILRISSSDNVYDPASDRTPTVLSWRPSHKQLWNLRSISSLSSSKQQQYANWGASLVTVFAYTPCDTGALTWQVPALETAGTKNILAQYTALDISIPPYLQEVTVHMQCGTTSWTDTWNRKNSLTIPTVQWTKKEHSVRVIASNADGHTIRLWSLKDQNKTLIKWALLNSKFIPHTLDGWEIELPLTKSNTIQFQLSNNHNQVILESEPITIDSQPLLTSTILSPLPPSNELNIQHLDTVHTLFVADGRNIWDWYNQPIWQSFHPSQESVPHSNNLSNRPPFLRWGDTLKISSRSFNGWHTEEKHTWIFGNPYDTTTPLAMSPEDGLFYDSNIKSVMGAALDISIERPSTHSTPWMIRTDAQISDERLLDFLPMLMEPSSLLASASILHHTALYWDAIQDRNLTWFNTLQERSLHSLKLLESVTNEKWTLLDFHTQLYIVWASLIADQEGLSPQSTFMRRNIHWLCTLSDTDIQEDAALISHLRWILKESHWKHRTCIEGESLPLIEHQATMDFTVALRDKLKRALNDRSTLRINTKLPQWQQWVLLEEEHLLLDRYTNLHVQLQTPTSTIRGLFHEWQIRPVFHTLSETGPVNIHVNGVGRLYLSTWQPYIHAIEAASDQNLQITRTILDAEGIPLPSKTVYLGQALQIKTTIQTPPNDIICIRQWGASGLSHQSKDHHFCTQSNDQGLWTNTEYVYVQFEGRFRLPITMVATESAVANTETRWLQTASIKDL